jgi:hypothetical protein
MGTKSTSIKVSAYINTLKRIKKLNEMVQRGNSPTDETHTPNTNPRALEPNGQPRPGTVESLLSQDLKHMDQSVVIKDAELFFKTDLHKKEQNLAKKNAQIEAERKQVTKSKQIYSEVKYRAKNLFMHLLKKPRCAVDNGIFLVECVSNLIKVHSEPGLPDFWDGFLVEEKEF